MIDVFPNLPRRYRPLSSRQTIKLCRWLDELNRYGWPKEIATATGRDAPARSDGFRNDVMDEIFRELGYRAWRKEKKQ